MAGHGTQPLWQSHGQSLDGAHRVGDAIALPRAQVRHPKTLSHAAGPNLRCRGYSHPQGRGEQDHVHMLIEDPPAQAVSDIVKRLKGRTSRLLQQAFPALQKRSWGKHCWAIGDGAWSAGNITEDLVAEYLEHHRDPSNQDTDPLILE